MSWWFWLYLLIICCVVCFSIRFCFYIGSFLLTCSWIPLVIECFCCILCTVCNQCTMLECEIWNVNVSFALDKNRIILICVNNSKRAKSLPYLGTARLSFTRWKLAVTLVTEIWPCMLWKKRKIIVSFTIVETLCKHRATYWMQFCAQITFD